MLITEARVWLYNQATDMRKSIDGLSLLVSQVMERNPTNGEIFVFWNRKRDKIKLIYWHINGFCLLYKRLEKERFKIEDNLTCPLLVGMKELRWLLEGLDNMKTTGHKAVGCSVFC